MHWECTGKYIQLWAYLLALDWGESAFDAKTFILVYIIIYPVITGESIYKMSFMRQYIIVDIINAASRISVTVCS